MLFEAKQVQFATNPNVLTAQEAGNYSKAELTNFRNRVFFNNQSDTTLKIWGKTISYDFLATSEKPISAFLSTLRGNRFNPYNVLRVDLHDYLLNIASLFAPGKLADAFIASLRFLNFILTHCEKQFFRLCNLFSFSYWSFISLKPSSLPCKKNNNSEFSSSWIFLNYTTSKRATASYKAERDKRQRTTFQHLDYPPEIFCTK